MYYFFLLQVEDVGARLGKLPLGLGACVTYLSSKEKGPFTNQYVFFLMLCIFH